MTLAKSITPDAGVSRVELATDPATRPNVLEVKGLGVRIGTKQIITDINLKLNQNEILAVIGPSGCGKTTFITTLNRMISHTAPGAHLEGDILLRGQSILGKDVDEEALRKRIGMVFQRPNPFPFSIRRNLEFALKACGDKNRASYPEKIENVLSAVKLWDSLKDRMNDAATSLSGGEQQRLCIARVLLCDPDVILFDEPCSALDPMSSAAVERLISDLKTRCSIVIVTHNLGQAKRISDRCAMFWHCEGSGCLVEETETQELMTNSKRQITRQYVSGEV
jgi:phosphate transport system ATP-binding protein